MDSKEHVLSALMDLAPDIIPQLCNAFRCVMAGDQVVLEFYYIPVPPDEKMQMPKIRPIVRLGISLDSAQTIIDLLQGLRKNA